MLRLLLVLFSRVLVRRGRLNRRATLYSLFFPFTTQCYLISIVIQRTTDISPLFGTHPVCMVLLWAWRNIKNLVTWEPFKSRYFGIYQSIQSPCKVVNNCIHIHVTHLNILCKFLHLHVCSFPYQPSVRELYILFGCYLKGACTGWHK